MTLYVPTGTSPVITGALARIERRLPQPGEVLVRAGQRVEPDDIIARAFVSGTPQIINLARALMIPPSQVERAMIREIGNKVAQGEDLVRTGLLGRRVPSPVSGIITAVDRETGYVTISPDPVTFELQATVRGLVMDVFPQEGVRIETPAAQVFGAFGVGRERSGVLRLLVTDPSEAIVPEMIDARSAYAITIGGRGISAQALRRAAQEQVRGIIVGSIDEAELRAFLGAETLDCWRMHGGSWRLPAARLERADDLTIVVTEGFGDQPMSAPIFDLLAEHDRQEALVVGDTVLRSPQQRPRVVIPLSSRSANVQLDPPRPTLRPGAVVRLLDHDHLGQIGQVRGLSAAPRQLASRVRTAVADILLENGTVITLPRTAVEVLSSP